MSISDELRVFADEIDGYARAKVDRFNDDLGCISYLNEDGITKGAFTPKWFRYMADRIDAEMVELPRDANGETLHLSDKAYDRKGNEQTALIFELYGEEEPTWTVSTDYCTSLSPSVLTHERPDSLERISQELEEWSEDNRVNGDANVFSRAAYFAERIRKLVKEGA